jgi:protease-3
MLNVIRIAAYLLLGALIPIAAAAADSIIKPPQDTRDYAELTLKNELRVIAVSDPDAAVSAAVMLVEAGTYQDPDEFTGMAHYLEHMILQGSKQYPELNGLSKLVSNNSGALNAYTYPDKTQYFFSIPNAHFAEALSRFGAQFTSPLLDPEYSDKERQAIHNEWSSGRESDAHVLARISGLLSNKQHPINRLGVGNKNTLRDQGEVKLHDKLVEFYQRYYSANQMTLVLSGKQSTKTLLSLAKKHFSQIPNTKVAKPQVTTPGLTQDNLAQFIQYQPFIEARELLLEFSIAGDDDIIAYKPFVYLNQLLTSSQPGTLIHQLKDKFGVNSISVTANPNSYGNNGTYTIIFNLTEDALAHRDDIISATFAYLNLLGKKGITKAHYDALKALLNKDFTETQQPDLLSLSNYLAESARHNRFKQLLHGRYALEGFNKNLIASTLAQLQPHNMRLWLIAPEAEVDTKVKDYEGAYKVTPISAKQIARWQAQANTWQLSVPEPIKLQDSTADTIDKTLTTPKQVVNRDGARAWLMHSQHFSDKKGSFYWVFNNDLGEQNPKNFVLSYLLKELLLDENESLLQRYRRMGVNGVIERTPYSAPFIQLLGDTDKQPELFAKLMASLKNLNYSKRQFKRARNNAKDWVKNWDNAQPMEQMRGVFYEYMEQPARNSRIILPYIDSVTPEELNRYKDKVLNQSTFLALAFGHYSEATLNKMVASAESTVKKRAPKPIYQKRYIAPTNNVHIAVNRESDQGDNALLEVFLSNQRDINQQANILLINTMFHNTLFTMLRTQEQLAYNLGSGPMTLDHHPGLMIFIQSENTELAELKQRLDKFRRQFAQFLPTLEPETLDTLKTSLLARLQQKPLNLFDEGSVYLNDFVNGHYQFDSLPRLIAAVKAATPDSLNKTYTDLLQGDSFNILIQQKGTDFKTSDFAAPEGYKVVPTSLEFQTLMEP